MTKGSWVKENGETCLLYPGLALQSLQFPWYQSLHARQWLTMGSRDGTGCEPVFQNKSYKMRHSSREESRHATSSDLMTSLVQGSLMLFWKKLQNKPPIGVGCYFLLQRLFPTQGLNLGLLYCRQFFFYCLSHQGSPNNPKNPSFSFLFTFTTIEALSSLTMQWDKWILFLEELRSFSTVKSWLNY